MVYIAALNDLAIAVQFIGNGQILVHGHEVHVVMEGHHACCGIESPYPDRTVDILILHNASVGAAIRIDQSIHTEVAVVGIFAVVAAVPVHRFAVGRLPLVNSMVAPFPNKPAAHTLVLLDELPVVFQISRPVAHCVSVFTHQVGLVRVGVRISLQVFDGGVHIGIQVDIGEVILALSAAVLGAFVMGQAGGVEVLCPRQSRLEAAAIGTFVAHGPADHTGAVLIPDHTPLGAIQRRFQKVGVIRKGFIPVLHMVLPQLVFRTVHFRRAVALMVGLVDDHKSVLVAELIEYGGVGIVSGANGIEVVLLHHLQIPL